MIEATALTKRFGEHAAVEDLSFSAPAGQVTAFLGPNGAGKTTTFRMLLGLARPTAGEALIDGRPYDRLDDPRRTVGAVLEASGFHPARSGRDHLRVIATAAGLDRGRVDEMLGLVGLRGAASRRVGGYSLGMRQRLALAGALLGDPRVLVLDEPTNGLDPEGVAWMRGLVRELAAEGRCVVVASHLLAEVVQAADRVVIIANGRARRESDVASLSATTALTVRADDPARLAQALGARDLSVESADAGILRVRGTTAEEVGRAAVEARVAIFELSSGSAGESLEALFLSLTGDDEQAA